MQLRLALNKRKLIIVLVMMLSLGNPCAFFDDFTGDYEFCSIAAGWIAPEKVVFSSTTQQPGLVCSPEKIIFPKYRPLIKNAPTRFLVARLFQTNYLAYAENLNRV